MAEIARQLREINRLDESTAEFMRAHEAAAIELEELERSIVTYRTRLEIDPEALQWMEERLNLLQSLERKHHRDEDGLLELMEELKGRLERLDRREEMLAEIDARLADPDTHTDAARRRTDPFQNARSEKPFKIDSVAFERSWIWPRRRSRYGLIRSVNRVPTGFETVEFLFAANPGEPLKPLRAVASSGEISRVMLAVKTALAQQDLVGLLVFDEIDANVGGEIAHSIGTKMRSLGETSTSDRDHPYAAGCGGRRPSLQR